MPNNSHPKPSFLVHFFLETCLFGGGWRFFRKSTKNPGFSCPAHPRWSWCLGKPSCWTCAAGGRKKAHDTPAKINKCPLKRDHLKSERTVFQASFLRGYVVSFFGGVSCKTHSRFLNKNHVKVTPPNFLRVILNWCLFSLPFSVGGLFVFGSSRPCLLPIFVGAIKGLPSWHGIIPAGQNPLEDGRSDSPVLKKAYFLIEKETFRYWETTIWSLLSCELKDGWVSIAPFGNASTPTFSITFTKC